jgi:predicted 3-demethylubiquinone-9 3-methyltransferase (glyoxalase superfamily)
MVKQKKQMKLVHIRFSRIQRSLISLIGAKEVPFPKNQVMNGVFEIDGQRFYAFDAGPQFKFTEAISFFVNCETQEEIDNYWNTLTSDGGQESMCGWLKG